MGKTIQVAGFLHGLFHSEAIESVLLVADVSLIQNWNKELERWYVFSSIVSQVLHRLFMR